MKRYATAVLFCMWMLDSCGEGLNDRVESILPLGFHVIQRDNSELGFVVQEGTRITWDISDSMTALPDANAELRFAIFPTFDGTTFVPGVLSHPPHIAQMRWDDDSPDSTFYFFQYFGSVGAMYPISTSGTAGTDENGNPIIIYSAIDPAQRFLYIPNDPGIAAARYTLRIVTGMP